MAIKRPDIYEHNNPVLAIVDSNFLKGGGRVVADLTALYALSDRPDQLKERVTRVYVTAESAYYVLVDDASIGTSAGWEVESGGGGNPSGVSGAIQFSDGSAFASDAANLFWDDTNNRLGIGTNAPTNLLHVSNTARLSNIYIGQAANTAISNTGSDTTINLNNGVGIAGSSIITPTARLHIQGSGTTSATTSLLVQNSAGTDLAKFNDDGSISFGSKISISAIGTINANGNLYALNGSSCQVTSTGNFRFVSASQIWSDSDGIVRLGNWANNGFTMLRLGGQTASFPGIKRVSNNIEIKNADDTFGAGVSVGGALVASAILQADSTTAGFLPPRMTTTQKNAISSPAAGLVVYDSTVNRASVYSTAWENVITEVNASPNSVSNIWSGSQAQYDALTPNASTLYFIV
jgi:hypothetical protein